MLDPSQITCLFAGICSDTLSIVLIKYPPPGCLRIRLPCSLPTNVLSVKVKSFLKVLIESTESFNSTALVDFQSVFIIK